MIRSFTVILCTFLSYCAVTAQNNYPIPEKTSNQLFYIQHSNNHNTYVYDYNEKNGVIDSNNPIHEYRIAYTEGGERQELSTIQRKMAYGVTLLESTPNVMTFRLAATDNVLLYLELNDKENPKIFVTPNDCKLYLDNMFVQLKDGLFSTSIEVDYILFYGTAAATKKQIIERLEID